MTVMPRPHPVRPSLARHLALAKLGLAERQILRQAQDDDVAMTPS